MTLRYPEELPDSINTETEYKGRVPNPNSVGALGPETRDLSSSEKLRLTYLTGQDEDPDAPQEPGFMGGVDSRYPEHSGLPPRDYRSPDYLE